MTTERTRRQFLCAGAAIGAVGLAGCGIPGGEDEEGEENGGGDGEEGGEGEENDDDRNGGEFAPDA